MLFSTRLRGRGAVTLSFTNSAEFGTFADRVSYRFAESAATPEPGTILLLASGVAGLWKRRSSRPSSAWGVLEEASR